MNQLKKSIAFQETGIFPEQDWIDLRNRISNLFHLNDEDQKKLMGNKMAKLVAAIPYLALCNEPKRTALTHLTTLFLASHEAGRDIFLHNFSDNFSLLNRLERISNFDGGNRLVIDRGMNLLSIVMLSDHIKDSIEDKMKKKYNPVESGIWNAQNEIKILEKKIRDNQCPEMEKIINVDEAKANWWHIP